MKQIDLQKKIRNKFIKQGVKMIDPNTVYFSKDTKIGKNVTIEPFVVIGSKVKIKDNAKILSFSHIEGVIINENVSVGPFCRLRPGTILEKNSKIGNFVEVKKSKVKKNSKVSHLSYIGDTTIGTSANIGAGTITCNYDGVKKSKTVIGDNSFVGSNSSLVAPVKIGRNSTIGAGSVITQNVKDGNLSLTRSAQLQSKYKRKK
jgi:bifunctional UDP-N-acetylglucosamine pyrophosphorylase/glucosamine-1-phosphate N-acetyltransferase